MPPAGLEPAIPASERQQTHALERAATGIDNEVNIHIFVIICECAENKAKTACEHGTQLFHTYSSSATLFGPNVPVFG
jgi:hypothetical protein